MDTLFVRKPFSRRDFFRLSALVMAGTGLTACSRKINSVMAMATSTHIPEATKSPTSTLKPTKAPTATPQATATQVVPDLERQLKTWGPAERIPVFEFHGDKYDMYDGRYAMTPESFVEQMTWFSDNDFHAVTGPELTAFLDGTIDLPKRSMVLTTDSGKGSINSMPRVIPVLLETGMHFNSFIWTIDMPPECPSWDVFEEGLKLGVLTIGSHSEKHSDFAKYSPRGVVLELKLSKEKIEDRLGVEINSISWPLESCPASAKDLLNIGYKYAFGGWSRDGVAALAVKKADKNPWCLPRIFPPNEEGISMRPKGLTLKETMELYMGEEIR